MLIRANPESTLFTNWANVSYELRKCSCVNVSLSPRSSYARETTWHTCSDARACCTISSLESNKKKKSDLTFNGGGHDQSLGCSYQMMIEVVESTGVVFELSCRIITGRLIYLSMIRSRAIHSVIWSTEIPRPVTLMRLYLPPNLALPQ